MQAATLPITAGWQWISDGWALFKRQPLAMVTWSLFIAVLFNFSYMLPILGQVILIGLTPLLTFLALCACRRISQGDYMGLGLWLQPLKNNPTIKAPLIKLGVIYLAFNLIAAILATLPFLDALSGVFDASGEVNPDAIGAAIRGPFITFGVLYVLISALFWHAPALIGWHGIKIAQAMFYSMVACWRNKGAFLIYGASWAALFYGVQMLANFMLATNMNPATVHLLLSPLNLLMAAILYCSFYPAYLQIFGANARLEQSAP